MTIPLVRFYFTLAWFLLLFAGTVGLYLEGEPNDIAISALILAVALDYSFASLQLLRARTTK